MSTQPKHNIEHMHKLVNLISKKKKKKKDSKVNCSYGPWVTVPASATSLYLLNTTAAQNIWLCNCRFEMIRFQNKHLITVACFGEK